VSATRTGDGRPRVGRTPRSLLFAPGSDPRKLARATGCATGLVVADLEDSVREQDKARARDLVADAIANHPAARCAVRVNALDTVHAAEDLAMVARAQPAAVVVPKARVAALAALDRSALPPLIPIVETPAGLQESDLIARLDDVWALLLGGVDLARAMRLVPRADGLELLFARSKLVMDSASAGIAPPIDVVHTDIRAADALGDEARLARSLGFGGKACIHPEQVPVVEAAFAPSAVEVEWARRVVRGFEAAQQAGLGAADVAGEMVDLPVYERALDIVYDAQE
jgi:citrate lyase beta subunit